MNVGYRPVSTVIGNIPGRDLCFFDLCKHQFSKPTSIDLFIVLKASANPELQNDVHTSLDKESVTCFSEINICIFNLYCLSYYVPISITELFTYVPMGLTWFPYILQLYILHWSFSKPSNPSNIVKYWANRLTWNIFACLETRIF